MIFQLPIIYTGSIGWSIDFRDVSMNWPTRNNPYLSQTIDIPVTRSLLTLRYLGRYEYLFDSPVEEPIPTWTAILWLLEDYGMSRTEEILTNIY